jgi:hypothetical protein
MSELEVITRSQLNNAIWGLKRKRNELLKQYIEAHPEMSYPVIGRLFELLPTHVAAIAKQQGIRRKRGKKVKTTKQ